MSKTLSWLYEEWSRLGVTLSQVICMERHPLMLPLNMGTCRLHNISFPSVLFPIHRLFSPRVLRGQMLIC